MFVIELTYKAALADIDAKMRVVDDEQIGVRHQREYQERAPTQCGPVMTYSRVEVNRLWYRCRMARMRTAIAASIVVASLVTAFPAAQQRLDQLDGDALYAAYLASGPGVLTGAFPNVERFEAFRADFRGRVLSKWEQADREPRRAMFMLDISLATEGRRFKYWSDFLMLGQTYLRQRTSAPGANARMDAFELLWNKTAVAYLEGRRQPELVEDLVKGLVKRIVVSPPGAGPPMLVDPWIAFTLGFMHEGYVIADAARFASRLTRALDAYNEAAQYDTNRAEALVRAAGLHLRAGKPADALAALDRLQESWSKDAVVIYWARLLRGKALDALDRPDESIAAYERALQVAPSAQSPIVGMMMAESRRGRDAEAEALAVRARTAQDNVADPWWIYPHGELRVFDSRLAALREMAK